MTTERHEELCKLAYRFWQERGCPHGSPEVDWQRAEQELSGAEHERDVRVGPADSPRGHET
jgi:hypothetical protein